MKLSSNSSRYNYTVTKLVFNPEPSFFRFWPTPAPSVGKTFFAVAAGVGATGDARTAPADADEIQPAGGPVWLSGTV